MVVEGWEVNKLDDEISRECMAAGGQDHASPVCQGVGEALVVLVVVCGGVLCVVAQSQQLRIRLADGTTSCLPLHHHEAARLTIG